MRGYAHKAFEKIGIEICLGEAMTAVTETRVWLKSGEELKSHPIIWADGIRANPLTKTLGLQQKRGGGIGAHSDLSVAGHPEVFVASDMR